MLFNRIYDEQDLARYNEERAAAQTAWESVFESQGVPQKLIESFARQASQEKVAPPKLAGLEVVHTGTTPDQHFSTPLITELISLGIAEIDGSQLVIHATPEDLNYMVLRQPGRYCLHCDEKLTDDQNGEMARLHVAMKHNGAPPIDGNPTGYEDIRYFDCLLDPQQHARLQYRKE